MALAGSDSGELLGSALEGGSAAALAKTEGILDDLATKALEGFRQTQSSVVGFRGNLEALLKSEQDRDGLPGLAVLIDELDRCRPTYAIAMLERIKHLFDADSVIFVLATDTGQMAHSVRAVYGAEFDSHAYLRRFFDRTYQFQEPSTSTLVTYLLASSGPDLQLLGVPGETNAAEVISECFDAFGLSLRDAEQCLDVLHSVAAAWKAPVRIELSVIVPMIIGNHLGLRPVALSDDFIGALAKKARRNWTIKLARDRSNSSGFVDGQSLFALFCIAGKEHLMRVANKDTEGSQNRYVINRFIEEAQTVIGPTDKAWSVLTTYPLLVTQAGRISDYPSKPRS